MYQLSVGRVQSNGVGSVPSEIFRVAQQPEARHWHATKSCSTAFWCRQLPALCFCSFLLLYVLSYHYAWHPFTWPLIALTQHPTGLLGIYGNW